MLIKLRKNISSEYDPFIFINPKSIVYVYYDDERHDYVVHLSSGETIRVVKKDFEKAIDIIDIDTYDAIAYDEKK